MKNNEIYQLSQDLIHLYAKVQHKGIEDLYIECLSQVEDTSSIEKPSGIDDQNAFWEWIKENHAKFVGKTRSSVATALAVLRLSKEYRLDVANFTFAMLAPKKDLNETMMKIRNQARPDTFGTISSLRPLIDDPSFNQFLEPFRGEIETASEKFSGDIDASIIRDDINLIVEAYRSTVATSSDKPGMTLTKPKIDPKQVKIYQIQMFSSLLNRASQDVAGEMERLGYNDAAQKIRAGALSQPNVLNQIVPLEQTTTITTRMAEEVVDKILNRYEPENIESNYEIIKKDALANVGAQFEEPPQREFDPSQYMGEKLDVNKIYEEIEERPKSTKIKGGWWTHPPILTMLTMIFYLMRKKIYGR